MLKFLALIALVSSTFCHGGFLKEFNAADMKLKTSSMVADQVIQAMDGFFTTVGVYTEVPSFASCKNYDFGVIKDSINVITDAMTGNYLDLAKALYSLGTNAWNIYSTCDSAGFVTQSEAAWKDLVANFQQPDYSAKVQKQFQNNMFQIMASAQALYNNLNNDQFLEFGKGLGSLARLVFVIQQ